MELNYIGLETVDIAKERIRYRVINGGHGIPDEVVERRYIESLINLKSIVGVCDIINIYDNTNEFKLVMSIENGEITWRGKILPSWCENIY